MSFDTFGIDLVANTGTFVGNVNSAAGAMHGLNQSANSLGAIGAQIKKFAAPVIATVGAAFAAKRALAAYAESTLPGAAAYVAKIDSMKTAIVALAAAAGEGLAPAAIKTATSIQNFARWLTPLVRQFTALSASAQAFGQALLTNFVKALGPLFPTVQRTFDRIMNWWNSGSTDWDAVFQRIRESWILNYTAPLIAGVANVIEASFTAIGEMIDVSLAIVGPIVRDAVEQLSGLIPATDGAGFSFAELADTIQTGLVTALVAAEYAVEHWQLSMQIASTAVELGFEIARSSMVQFFTDLWANVQVIGSNAGKLFEAFAEPFKSLGQYIADVFKFAFEYVQMAATQMIQNLFASMRTLAGALLGSFGQYGEWVKNVAMFAYGFTRTVVGMMAESLTRLLEQVAIVAKAVKIAIDPMGGVRGVLTDLMNEGTKEHTQRDRMPQMPAFPQLNNPFQMPAMEALPGFNAAAMTKREEELRAQLKGLTSEFGDGFGAVLADKLKWLRIQAELFALNVKKNLPGLSATPALVANPKFFATGESTKHGAALLMGSKGAYEAILKAQDANRDIPRQQLKVAQKQVVEAQKANKMLTGIDQVLSGLKAVRI